MKIRVTKNMRLMLLAAAIAAVNSQTEVRSYAGLFKIDFGQLENERAPKDVDGNPVLDANGNEVGPPAPLIDWTVIPTWTYVDPNAAVLDGTASVKGTAGLF